MNAPDLQAPDVTAVAANPGRYAVAYRNAHAWLEDVDLEPLARSVGTPCYVYSAGAIVSNLEAIESALSPRQVLICYAVKANGSLAVLRLLASKGAGADIVSIGEWQRARAAGIPPHRVVFSGVGKLDEEIEAALRAGLKTLNVESAEELERISQIATRLSVRAPVCLRINPDVDPATHPYLATGLRTAKFGIAMAEAPALAMRAAQLDAIDFLGVGFHIGSQIVEPGPIVASVERVRTLVESLQRAGIPVRHLDLGGGLGIPYAPEDRALDVAAWGERMLAGLRGLDAEIVLEPGRYVVGNAGVLLTRVVGQKRNGERRFVITDAAMNDLLRPALYQAYHGVVPARLRAGNASIVDVVGPVCESGDFLAKDRLLPPVQTGDVLVILSAGAYAMSMASTYNTRMLPAEVLVHGKDSDVTRGRRTVEEVLAEETIPTWIG